MKRTYSNNARSRNANRSNRGGGGPRRSSGGGRSRSGGGRRKGQYIDPKKFVKQASKVEKVAYAPEFAFTDFALNNLLQNNLRARKFTAPSQIQDLAIPILLKGRDVVGIANTGTGKTAAFLLPLINKLMAERNQKVLIIAPTRELALQIEDEFRAFSKGSRLFSVLLIGGTPINKQLRHLRNRPQFVIGTPGRIKDHLDRGTLKLNDARSVVLDEVDRMLDMGFIKDITTILQHLPAERHSMFFSATTSRTIEDLIGTFSNDPFTIMARTAETSDNVDQSVIKYVEKDDKIEKLKTLLLEEHVQKTIIFSDTKYGSDRLSKALIKLGFNAVAMHGGKSQGQRQRALTQFKDNRANVLVATDVAARGIDVAGITHVVNYDLPQTYDDYTHRIGRTGRGDATGFAITFLQHDQR